MSIKLILSAMSWITIACYAISCLLVIAGSFYYHAKQENEKIKDLALLLLNITFFSTLLNMSSEFETWRATLSILLLGIITFLLCMGFYHYFRHSTKEKKESQKPNSIGRNKFLLPGIVIIYAIFEIIMDLISNDFTAAAISMKVAILIISVCILLYYYKKWRSCN